MSKCSYMSIICKYNEFTLYAWIFYKMKQKCMQYINWNDWLGNETVCINIEPFTIILE